MDKNMIEVKARYDNGKVYFEQLPELKKQSFEFIANIPQACLAEKTLNFLSSLPADKAQAILEKMTHERKEHDCITQGIVTDTPELSKKQKQHIEAFALYDKCK